MIAVRWLGDKFVFQVAYKDLDGNPIALDATAAKPGGAAFIGTTPDPISLTLTNGHVTIVDGAAGKAQFVLHPQDYAANSFTKTTDGKPNYNRLQCWIEGTDTEHMTYVVTEVPVLDPRTGDLDTVAPPPQTVVAIVGPQGPKGDRGDVGGTFTHEQPVAALSWVINHGLGRYPSVTLVDSANDVFLADIHYDNDNTITITLTAACAGRAFCN